MNNQIFNIFINELDLKLYRYDEMNQMKNNFKFQLLLTNNIENIKIQYLEKIYQIF